MEIELNMSRLNSSHLTLPFPKGQTVNGVFYLGIMQRLLARICRVPPEYCEIGSWRLLQDNTPAHRSTLIWIFWQKMKFCLSTIVFTWFGSVRFLFVLDITFDHDWIAVSCKAVYWVCISNEITQHCQKNFPSLDF